MPQYQISVPGKGTFRVDSPTELTDLQAWQAVQSQLAAGPEQPQKSTITGELVRGGKQLVSSTRTGLESVVSPEKAALAGVERGQKISEEAGEGPSFAAVRKAYEERGLLPAAGEVLSQIPRALAGQGAQLAAMAGGARLGAMAGAPLGPAGVIGGGILGAGATLLPQFMGANVERQAQEQLERGEPVSIDRTKAYGAAAGQAALEGAGTAFVLGKRVVKGVLGIADDAALATAKAQQELAKAAARSVAASAGRGALRGTAEIPVEVAQSVLERAQAGLDLTSPEALSEYGESAYLAGLVGPTLGGAAGVAERSGARAKQAEVAPAPVAPTLEAPVAPTVTPEQVRQRVEEVTGVSRATPPSAEESVLGRLYKLGDEEAEVAREELTRQRLLRQQEEIDAEAERIAELNRKQGMPSPDRPKLEIEERPSIAETPPALTPREELLAKQAEVDQRRLEAGLPTGESSVTPGVQPAPEVAEEPKPVPKIVDDRPLTERAAQNRLLVMRNMLQNQGGDPQSLTIVPHPTVEGKFAIQSLDVPTKLAPDLPRTAITRPETPTIIDPVNAYVEIQRRTNTPAARRFVQEYEAGRITREDVERAIEQEQKAGQPQPLTYTATGAPGIVAPEVSKPRGEREVPKLGETPPKVEAEPPVDEPPGEEPPPPKATLPQTLEEFEARMPVVFDKAEVREANNQGNFAKLTKALQLSSNPAIRRIGQLGAGIASKITLRKPGKLGRGVAGVYRYADDSIQMIPSYAGDEHVNAHETLHALISKAQRFPTDRQKPVVQQIDKLFEHVKKELKKKGITAKEAYGLTNAREFTAEAMTNPKFQYELMQIPYPGKKSSWTQFVRLVADLLGIQNTNALTEVMNLVDRLAAQKQPRKTVTDRELTDEMAMLENAAPSGEATAASPTAVEAAAPKAEAPTVETPAPPVEAAAPVMEAAAPSVPVAEAPSRSSEAWRTEGKTPQELMADKVESLGVELAMQIAEEASAKDFAPTELPAAIQQWANDSKVPADDLRASVIKALDKFDISEARKAQVKKALSPLRAAPKAEAPPQELKSLGKAEAKQNFQQALRPLLNKFGLKDVELKIEEGMDDDGSYSQQLIRLAAQQANPVRTLRHESVHALRELGFFTDAQWKSLSKMAKEKWVDQYLKQRNVQGRPLKAGEESRYDAYMREYNGDMEKITEEAVADAFADFDATKPPAGLIQALLKRMKDLFQSIKSALTKVESPEQIFGKVEKGELKPGEKRQAGERKSVRDRATANFLRWFGDSKVVDEKGEPLVVYHGTNQDFTAFDPEQSREGDGIVFVTPNQRVASDFSIYRTTWGGANVMPLYVKAEKVLEVQGGGRSIRQVEKDAKLQGMKYGETIRDFAMREGYNAIVFKDVRDPVSPDIDPIDDVWALMPTAQIKSAIGNNGDYSLTNPDIRKSLGKATDPGQQALDLVNSMNMGIPQSEPGFFKRLTNILKGEEQMPDLNLKKAKEVAIRWSDQFEKNLFSADAPFQNALRRGVKKDLEQNAETVGLLVQTSISQTVGIDNVVNKAIIDGGADYSEDMKKWHSVVKKDNMKVMADKLQEIAQKYNKTSDEMKSIAHAYLVSKRLPGILQRNEELTENIKAEKATAKPDRKKIEEWQAQLVHVSNTQIAQMDKGLSLVNLIPELPQVSDILNGIRENFIDVAVKSGLWTREYAEAMLNNVDYVPYYRVEQLEENAGPLEFLRGLQVKAKEHKLKGSDSPVNDVFDNMVRWSSFLLNRSMRAHKAKQMIYAAKDIELGGRKMAVKVTEPKKGMNIVRVFNNGVQELWDVADPNFVDAFAATQNVSIPMFKAAAWVAEKLRNMIVLYPMFSVAQVPQDSVAAVFTSGLKPQFALRIPYLAVKEFVKTIAKTSATHNELAKFGVVGARDFSADVMRKDAEIEAGLKSQKGTFEKTKEILEHIAMAGDNAVRQATYIAARQQGVSEMEALEKSFEIFNVRRRGTSKALNLAGQTIPFFYAYLAAQRVAYKTITGVGTSPTTRRAALETLAYTTAAVMTLSMLYAMMVADDEDYAETPAAVRDRTITIPGTGGVRIPLRPDFFLFPKIVAEHTYLMLTDRGYEDGAKFRTSMKDALFNAVTSPTVIPQIVKPALEVGINYSFFEGRPVVGQFEKEKALERQFNDSTSELSKLLGQTGLVSPIAADHLIRGMLGSVGGLILFGSNFFSSDPDVPRPELSWGEVAAALPGTSGFLKRPQESALKNDFFLLRNEVEKAVNTFNDIKTRSPQGMEDFLDNEKMMARYMLGKPVDQINRQLSKIRRQMTIITNMPESMMSASEKADFIRELREYEREYLKSVDVKALREMAKI